MRQIKPGGAPGPLCKPIDWDMVELALKAGSTTNRIAASQQVSHDTLSDRAYLHYGIRWPLVKESFRKKGEMLIEAKQFECAMKGNVKMLIYLGKVRLKQVEAVLEESNRGKDLDITNEHKLIMLQHQLSTIKDLLTKKGIDLEKEIELNEAIKKGEQMKESDMETVTAFESVETENGDDDDEDDEDGQDQ